jgi:hypothetical protein
MRPASATRFLCVFAAVRLRLRLHQLQPLAAHVNVTPAYYVKTGGLTTSSSALMSIFLNRMGGRPCYSVRGGGGGGGARAVRVVAFSVIGVMRLRATLGSCSGEPSAVSNCGGRETGWRDVT